MAWQNPLSSLPLIPPHPASVTSELSSALTNPDLLHELGPKVDQVLNDFGKHGKSNDRAESILKAFLAKLGNHSKVTLRMEILAFSLDEQKLLDLAQHLVDAILKPFKLASRNSPPSAVTPSPAVDAAEIEAAIAFTESSTRKDQRALKMACLRRDGYKCIYTGFYDLASMEASLVDVPEDSPVATTECAHIIPFALGKFDDSKAVETRNNATIWFAIHRYFPDLQGKIHAGNINQPANTITLTPSVHDLFGNYKLTFLPKDSDHVYGWHFAGGRRFGIPVKSGGSEIELDHNDPGIPLPDREYFKVHHCISQILQVSGVGREIEDEMEKVLEGPRNLDPGGSTDIGLLISQRMLMDVGK